MVGRLTLKMTVATRMVEVASYGEGFVEYESDIALWMTRHPCVVATSR